MTKPIYLDYAAATPLDDRVLAAMQPFFADDFYNPSALYDAARQTRKTLEAARAQAAAVLGARPSEIVFTAGGTESDNLAIQGIMRRFPDANIITSAIEHDAVLAPAGQYNHRLAPVHNDGLVDLEQLEKLIDDNTVLVSIMYANNEIGSVQPISKIAQKLQAVRDERRRSGNKLPLYFHTDACQAGQYLDLHVSRLGVDLLTINGGKMHGPKQSGLLYVRGGLELEPLILGGGQERGLRSGTENVAACVGLAVALELAQVQRHDESRRLQALQKQFFTAIETQLPQAVIRGSRKLRLPNNVHLTIPGIDNERLLIQLDEAGILAAAGSACSASSETPSHVLRALGLNDDEARASLRFSMGRGTTADHVTTAVETLARLVA
ncbi:MAG: Aminotransferase [Candidatus Saccharibacteria bacterium]|nr:Aminotransferase [Candidatus Saccharibacteria bacterium]